MTPVGIAFDPQGIQPDRGRRAEFIVRYRSAAFPATDEGRRLQPRVAARGHLNSTRRSRLASRLQRFLVLLFDLLLDLTDDAGVIAGGLQVGELLPDGPVVDAWDSI